MAFFASRVVWQGELSDLIVVRFGDGAPNASWHRVSSLRSLMMGMVLLYLLEYYGSTVTATSIVFECSNLAGSLGTITIAIQFVMPINDADHYMPYRWRN